MSDDTDIPPTTTEPLDDVSGRALVEAWRSSGMSGAAFCRERGIRAQRLHYWRERLGYPIKVVGEPVRSAGAPAQAMDGFVQMVVRDPAMPSSQAVTQVDIVVGGWVVRVGRGFDAVLLREVVKALGEGA